MSNVSNPKNPVAVRELIRAVLQIGQSHARCRTPLDSFNTNSFQTQAEYADYLATGCTVAEEVAAALLEYQLTPAPLPVCGECKRPLDLE